MIPLPRSRSVRASGAALLGLAACVGVGAGGLVGCPSNPTSALYVPVTGVTLHVSDVLGGLQCGTGPGQVYKYTVVVWDADADGGPIGQPIFSNVWDCFVDGVFENLPTADGGNASFFMKVFAYSYPATLAAENLSAPGAEAGDAEPADAPGPPLSAATWCPGGLGPNGTACPLEDASFAEALGNFAQWEATCTAVETEGAPITALCTPLRRLGPEGSPEGASDAAVGAVDAANVDATLDSPAPAADGPADVASDAPTEADSSPSPPADAGPDAADGGATDAPAESGPESGPDAGAG